MLFSLPAHAHYLAAMANRRVPSIRDFYTAIQFSAPRLRPNELEQYLRDVDLDSLEWQNNSRGIEARPAWCDPFEGHLPSESEDDSAPETEEAKEAGIVATRSKVAKNTPARKRRRKKFKVEMAEVPSHLPSLPPKHTWLSSPSYPAHSINLQPPLAFLDVKVSSNRLMEASLRGLIRATDAAVLDSQVQGSGIGDNGRKEDVQFDTEVFGLVNKRLPIDERPTVSPQTATVPLPDTLQSTTTGGETNEEENRSIRLKKGRTLSLRLRTPSTSQGIPQTVAINSAEPQTPFKRPNSISHRPSMSVAGPQSAALPTFGSHIRRNTYGSGPWSASSSQTQFNWNVTPSTGMMSPLATPLTPGIGYNYPPTPSDTYANEILSKEAGRQFDQTGSAPIGLPTTVNYKRTWYKKSNNKTSNANSIINQKRLKS